MQPKPRIELSGMFNLRDLGGYATAQGKTVKRGILYRSDDLSKLTESDLQRVNTLNIRTVVDFRGHSETNIAPDRLPASVIHKHHLPIDAGKILEYTNISDLTEQKSRNIMISAYQNFIHSFIPAFKMFFQILEKSENLPLLFHCTAGKDRTGLAAAMLLSALGVGEKDILEDYLLSNHYIKDRFIEGRDYTSMLKPLYTVEPAFLEAALSAINQQYGGMPAFLQEQLKVNIQALQNYYTQ